MSSHSDIEANRRNSQLSPASRTLKSAINPKALVILGEDPAELEAMTVGYHQEWQPTTYLERFLVDSLIRTDWLLQRLSRVEAELWAHDIENARTSVFHKLDLRAPVGDIYSRSYERFTRLQRRIDSTERSYYRALTHLQRLKVPPASPAETAELDDLQPGAPPSSATPTPPAPELPLTGPPPAPADLASFCRRPLPHLATYPPRQYSRFAPAPSRHISFPSGSLRYASRQNHG